LIIERPGQAVVLVEIKSTKEIIDDHGKNLRSIEESFSKPIMYVLNNAKNSIIKGNVKYINWKEGLKEIFDYK